MNVWPRLPLSVATSLAEQFCRLSRSELLDNSSDWHEAVILAPIGGTSVDRNEVHRLQALVRARMDAAINGQSSAEEARRVFDFEVSRLLLDEMQLAPHEAAQPGIWSFIACVVLPDVVRWRFPGDEWTGTPIRRFTDGNRGVRNAFGRLWWRAFVLRDAESADPWELVRVVLEDQALGLLERTLLMGHPPLAREMLRAVTASGGSRQQDVMRDLTKRLRRVAGVVPLETLAIDSLRSLVATELDRSLVSLGASGLRSQEQVGILPESAADRMSTSSSSPAEPRTTQGLPRSAVIRLSVSRSILEAGSLQGVVDVPETVVPALPALNEDFANPERNVIAVDADGRRWLWRYVHYNRSQRARRFEGLTGFLRERGACPGDQLQIRIRPDGSLEVTLTRQGAEASP